MLPVRSDDTALVYSTASAPLEIYDHLLIPQILFTSASSPSEMLSSAATSSRNANPTIPVMRWKLPICHGRKIDPKSCYPTTPQAGNRRWLQQQSVHSAWRSHLGFWFFPLCVSLRSQKVLRKRSLNSNHHLVEFFHVLWEGENGQPHGQRANVALILWLPFSRLASSQTPTDPKASLLSQCHPTPPPHHQPNPTYSYTKPATAIHWHPVDLPSRMAVTLPVRLST